jgi:hypothetical protein
VETLRAVVAEQDEKLSSQEKQVENDFDLIKVRPKASDLFSLQKSITKLEEEIVDYDPILYKELQIKAEMDREMEERLKASTPFRIVSLPQHAPSPTLQSALPLLQGRPSSSMLPTRKQNSSKRPLSATAPSRKSISRVSFSASSPTELFEAPEETTPGDVVEEVSTPVVQETTTDAVDSEIEVIDEKSVLLYLDCIRRKFKLLDDFVFVLKKKIQRLEQTDQDLNSLVSTFGSVEGLLEENEKMKREIHFLNWVKQRFSSDMLLQHEYLYSDDVHLLRAVIFALQNELL